MSYAKELYQQMSAGKVIPLTASVEQLKERAKEALRQAVHFSLPEGGLVIKDEDYRGLDADELHLPFRQFTLECKFPFELDITYSNTYQQHSFSCSKMLITVDGAIRDVFELHPEALDHLNDSGRDLVTEHAIISVSTYAYCPKLHRWLALDLFGLATKNWMMRTSEGVGFRWFPTMDATGDLSEFSSVAIGIVTGFLNATACSNVECQPHRYSKSKALQPIPFDEYYTLVIKAKQPGQKTGVQHLNRHGPREHLRRGHIRRLQTGKKVWVNAAVINAGSAGAIHKDYKVEYA